MQINSLELNNFRNYENLSMDFAEDCNIIYGENGQGKTNILESIYMCGFGKSHKGSKEKEIIRENQEEAHVKALFDSEFTKNRIDIHLKKNSNKGFAINGMAVRKYGDLYGKILIVMFSSEDLDIVKRSPSDRRKFIDMELCQIDPIYVEDLVKYGKILEQRKELFKKLEERGSDYHSLMETLDIWDLQLSEYGSRIIKRRKQFIEELNDIVFDIHYDISGGREKLKIVYEASASEENFYEELFKNRERDRCYKQTHIGPHRDDLIFYNGEKDLKVYGSNGQQRTCAISLKLSELTIIEKIKKEKPVLLLDDVLSELDRNRQRQLIKRLNGTQTIITCTGIDDFVENEFTDVKKFQISEGKLIK